MPERRPRLNVGAKHAFLYEYYEQCKNEDDEFFESICRVLIVNRGFLGTFFNRQSQKRTNEDEALPLFAYVNVARQTVEFKIDWNKNGIYTGALGTNTNLTLLKLTKFDSIQLCLVDFGEYSREMVRFWAAFCRILRENKHLKRIELYDYTYQNNFILDYLPDKLYVLETNDISFSKKRRKCVMDRLCFYSYSDLPDYTKLLQLPAHQIEVQRADPEHSFFQELLYCLPIKSNPSLQHLIIELKLFSPTCTPNFEPCEDAWSEKYFKLCAEFFEQLRRTNPKILIENNDTAWSENWIRTPDDALLAHNALLSNIQTFIDLAGSIKLKIPRFRVDNIIMKENYTANFAENVASKLKTSILFENKVLNACEYKGYCFDLQYSYRSA